jgi:hypothetical protein
VLAALAISLLLASAASAQESGDYPVPGGWFYTQAVPDRADGVGFAVQDGHGVALWTAVQERGGVLEVGYPISRRFEWDGGVAQVFQWGVLRWDAEAQAAALLPTEELPGGRAPAYALEPERPPVARAELEQKPWSGWWWPASPAQGATLFAPGGPLDKYDQYVANITGEQAGTRAWERAAFYLPGVAWAGHCNGWAAAALLEPEPTEPLEAAGVTFSVGDLKGLLAAYHFADAAAWSFGEGGILDPADFQRALLRLMSRDDPRGFILAFEPGGEEIWNFPAYRHETVWGPDPVVPEVWRVRSTVWMADPNVPLNFVGLKDRGGSDGITFEYLLWGDPRDPSGGMWLAPSEPARHPAPSRIWYPAPDVRNLERQLASPNLDRAVIGAILGETPIVYSEGGD